LSCSILCAALQIEPDSRGLVPATHLFLALMRAKQDVDARGHDGAIEMIGTRSKYSNVVTSQVAQLALAEISAARL